jgi:hypothetical protein
MYTDNYRPVGVEHELQLCLPEPSERTTGPGRTVRLYLFRGSGPDFCERDRALLTLLRPHLEHIYEKLQVSSRTAAVTRAFPDRIA